MSTGADDDEGVRVPGEDEVSEHMLGLGLGALAHANWHANYQSMQNKYWPELSVLQAAHAAEILIKARIAEEHPLLIFEQLPKAKIAGGGFLQREHLIEAGRTFQFADLPDRLWATTGVKLPNEAAFRQFGQLRNTIQHFTAPAGDLGLAAARFIFEVIDPFIHDCWGLFAVDFNEDHEPYVYLVARLVRSGITFLVSDGVVDNLKYTELDWPHGDKAYKAEMLGRFRAAGATIELGKSHET